MHNYMETRAIRWRIVGRKSNTTLVYNVKIGQGLVIEKDQIFNFD